MSTTGKHVKDVVVVDPDTGGEVTVSIFKLETGAMVGVDGSFPTDEALFSPYDRCEVMNLEGA